MNTQRLEDSTRPLNPIVSWCFLAAGVVLSGLALLDGSDSVRSFAFDALALVAAGGAVYGILRNRPDSRVAWLAPRDRSRALRSRRCRLRRRRRAAQASNTGYPWADLLYLSAYPFIAYALYRLARSHFRRDTTVDSAIVALAASAVIWQWVVTPVIATADGATLERIVAAAYPMMDVVLVVAIVHAVFTLPRWVPAAWFLFGGLAVMLVADTVYARLVADGAYIDGGALDALWPIAYFLLAAAALHPSMRNALVHARQRTGTPRTRAHDRARRGSVLGAGGRRPRRRGQ